MGTKRKLDEAIEQKKAREQLDQRRTEYENKLFTQSKELALSLRNKGTEGLMLKEEFDMMWSKWVTEMTKDTPPLEDLNFWEDVMQILSENHELTFVHERLNQKDYELIDRRIDYCDYIMLKKDPEYSDDTASSEEDTESSKKGLNAVCQSLIRDLIHKIIQETEKTTKNSPVGRRGYNDSYIQEITDCVKKSVQQHQSESQNYILKKEFTIDLSLHVCDIARQEFTELHKEFREACDPRLYLEKQKTQYCNVFMNFYRGTPATIQSEFICSNLEPSILQAVYNETAIGLAAQMRSDIEAFCENRPNLEKHILKFLAEKEDFKHYIKYIHNPRSYFKQFIKNEVKRYFTKQNQKILNVFKENLKQTEETVSNAMKAATVEAKSTSGDGNMWFRCFTTTLTDELKLTGNSCVDLSEIKDLDFLEKLLSDSLKEKMTNLQNSFKSINDIQMEKCRKGPDEILIEHFCQCCWVQCPFCKAICTNTMEDHLGDHIV
ncbi:hypothetical protein cypCar_00019184 [Cyprinus carpio]|nr:hypothetical protein cypCar_00019184 [Cyprinus carpio]